MTQQDNRRLNPRWIGVGLIVSYLFLSLIWVVTLSGLIVVRALQKGLSLEELDSTTLFDRLGTTTFVVQSAIQAVGFVGICLLLAAIAQRLQGDERSTRLNQLFGLVKCPARFLVVGFLGGLTVGIFPGWLVEQIKVQLPNLDLGTLDLINHLFQNASGLEYTALIFTLVIIAPVGEELVFRGFLWHSFERTVSKPFVWVFVTLLFSLYHMSLVQSVALLVTGGFIGWLRWTSGSLWPAVLAHIANNLMATIAVIAWASTETESIPGWSAGLTGLFTLAICAYAWRTRVREK